MRTPAKILVSELLALVQFVGTLFRIDLFVGEARYADRNILKRRLVVCVSLTNIVGYCIQNENCRIRRLKFDCLVHS